MKELPVADDSKTPLGTCTESGIQSARCLKSHLKFLEGLVCYHISVIRVCNERSRMQKFVQLDKLFLRVKNEYMFLN